MAQQILDYRSPPEKRAWANRRGVRRAAGVAAGIAVVVNAGLLLAADSDRSWGALGIEILIGPITNGVLILASLALIPVVRRIGGAASIAPYVLTGVLVPLMAVGLDTICIASMGLHGC